MTKTELLDYYDRTVSYGETELDRFVKDGKLHFQGDDYHVLNDEKISDGQTLFISPITLGNSYTDGAYARESSLQKETIKGVPGSEIEEMAEAFRATDPHSL